MYLDAMGAKSGARWIVAAWLFFVLTFLFVVIGFMGWRTSHANAIFVVLISNAVSTGIVGFVLARKVECPVCDELLFVEGAKALNARAPRIRGIDYWATAVLHAAAGRRMICMHCGASLAPR